MPGMKVFVTGIPDRAWLNHERRRCRSPALQHLENQLEASLDHLAPPPGKDSLQGSTFQSNLGNLRNFSESAALEANTLRSFSSGQLDVVVVDSQILSSAVDVGQARPALLR